MDVDTIALNILFFAAFIVWAFRRKKRRGDWGGGGDDHGWSCGDGDGGGDGGD